MPVVTHASLAVSQSKARMKYIRVFSPLSICLIFFCHLATSSSLGTRRSLSANDADEDNKPPLVQMQRSFEPRRKHSEGDVSHPILRTKTDGQRTGEPNEEDSAVVTNRATKRGMRETEAGVGGGRTDNGEGGWRRREKGTDTDTGTSSRLDPESDTKTDTNVATESDTGSETVPRRETEVEAESDTGSDTGAGVRRRRRSRRRQSRWVGDINSFLSQKRNLIREREERERGSIRTEYLKQSLVFVNLKFVYLEYYVSAKKDSGADYVKCLGGVCPDFQSCINDEGYGEVLSACHFPQFSDKKDTQLRATENCPYLGYTKDKAGVPYGIYNATCTYQRAPQYHKRMVPQVFTLQNVWLNARGQVFNETHYFDRNGCGFTSPERAFHFHYPPDTTRVTVFKKLVHLANWNSYAFYHGTIDFMPILYLLSDFMREWGGSVPITHKNVQSIYMGLAGGDITGLTEESMNLRIIPVDELFFAEEVIQPIYAPCARPNEALLSHLRLHHYLPPNGLPFLNPDWSRRVPARPASPTAPLPTDWLVVMAKRRGPRGLVQSDEVEDLMVERFGRERVVVFDGGMNILEAKSLFNRVRFLVGVHGAILTNMVFMPPRGHVLEIGPRQYVNYCFHNLAEGIGFKYYNSMASGNKQTDTRANMEEVGGIIRRVGDEMEEQWRREGGGAE